MKKSKLTLLSVVIVISLVFTAIIAPQASALIPTSTGYNNTLYYFTDFYTSVSYGILNYEFSNYNIVIDRQQITSQQFNNLITSNYFTGFGQNCIVVVDIKTFMPNDYLLESLFRSLRSQGCKTAFITIYNEGDYADTSFTEYLNLFIDDADFEILNDFNSRSFDHYHTSNTTINSTSYLIDGTLVDLNTYWGEDFDTLCSVSPFLRSFVICLVNEMFYHSYDYYDEIDFNILADSLIGYDVKFLVHLRGNLFVDILTWETYYCNDIYSVTNDIDPVTYYACAFGFWSLDSAYYQFLLFAQDESDLHVPVYALIVDPISYSSNALDVMTSTEFDVIEIDDAGTELVEGLHQL